MPPESPLQLNTQNYFPTKRYIRHRLRERDDRGWTPLHICARKGDLKEEKVAEDGVVTCCQLRNDSWDSRMRTPSLK